MYDTNVRRTAGEAARTRSAILGTALKVFSERGYSGTTLEEIATRAQVTRGALYHHFADKADLYSKVIGENWAEVFAPLFATLAGEAPAVPRLRRFLVSYFTALSRDQKLRELLELMTLRSEVLPEHASGMEAKRDWLAGWIADLDRLFAEVDRQHQLRRDIAPRAAAAAVGAFVNGVTVTALLTPELFSELTPDQLADLILGGLIT
jgi:TetR/AcrR family acrAB operon transcriptional repressor